MKSDIGKNGIMKKTLVVLFVILATGGAFFYFSTRQESAKAYPGGDFTLHSLKGPVSLSDYRGKVVVLYFGYTSCPDICPTALSLAAGALRRLSPEERKGVAGIFVSVDPERDGLKLLHDYATQFDPLIVGVTGSAEELKEIALRYGVYYKKVNVEGAMGYVVDHSSATYIIDREGRLAKTLNHGAPVDDVLAGIRQCAR